MKRILAIVAATMISGAASAASVDLTDGVFSNPQYETFVQGPLGPIIAFDEVVDGVTFAFSTTGQFRNVGPWGNGTSNAAAPWALSFGGGGGNASTFTLTVDMDITLQSFSGVGQQFNTNPIFDVTGSGVSSVGNTFSTVGFMGDAAGTDSFASGPLNLVAGQTYTFSATNAGVTTVGHLYGLSFEKVTMSPVPLPAGLPLLVAGLGALGLIGRRRRS